MPPWCSDIAGVPESEVCLQRIPSKYKTYYVTRLKQSNPILVLTTIYQVLLYVYYDVQQRDGDRSSGIEGMVIGTRTTHEESVMQAIGQVRIRNCFGVSI